MDSHFIPTFVRVGGRPLPPFCERLLEIVLDFLSDPKISPTMAASAIEATLVPFVGNLQSIRSLPFLLLDFWLLFLHVVCFLPTMTQSPRGLYIDRMADLARATMDFSDPPYACVGALMEHVNARNTGQLWAQLPALDAAVLAFSAATPVCASRRAASSNETLESRDMPPQKKLWEREIKQVPGREFITNVEDMSLDGESWAAICSFSGKILESTTNADGISITRLDFRALTTLIHALEEPHDEKELDRLVPGAAAWIIHGGSALRRNADEYAKYSDDGGMLKLPWSRGLLYKETKGPSGFNKQRWEFWSNRFHNIATLERISPRTRQWCLLAVEKMEKPQQEDRPLKLEP